MTDRPIIIKENIKYLDLTLIKNCPSQLLDREWEINSIQDIPDGKIYRISFTELLELKEKLSEVIYSYWLTYKDDKFTLD